MDEDRHTRYEGDKHTGPDHRSPYPVSRLAPPLDLVDAAREIAKADEVIRTHASGKLRVIAEQMRALRDQAEAIVQAAQRDTELHRAACHFQRRPGHVYHLYRKQNGALYLSMLSPEEWGISPPHEFVGSFRLEPDQSWTDTGT